MSSNFESNISLRPSIISETALPAHEANLSLEQYIIHQLIEYMHNMIDRGCRAWNILSIVGIVATVFVIST